MKRPRNLCIVTLIFGFTLFSTVSPNTAYAGSSPSQKQQQLKPNVFRPDHITRSNSISRALGASTANRQEVVAWRTRTSRTYALPGGFESDITAGSVNYQDSRGQWQPIDNTLVAASLTG